MSEVPLYTRRASRVQKGSTRKEAQLRLPLPPSSLFLTMLRLACWVSVQGYLAHQDNPLGPYSRTMPRGLWWS